MCPTPREDDGIERLLVAAAERRAVEAGDSRNRTEEGPVRLEHVHRRAGGDVEAALLIDRRAVARGAAAQLAELALVGQRPVRLHVERHDDRAVRHVERLLVGAQDDAVGALHALSVLRHDALRVGVEHAGSRDGDVDAAAAVGRQVVQHAAHAVERLAAVGRGQRPCAWVRAGSRRSSGPATRGTGRRSCCATPRRPCSRRDARRRRAPWPDPSASRCWRRCWRTAACRRRRRWGRRRCCPASPRRSSTSGPRQSRRGSRSTAAAAVPRVARPAAARSRPECANGCGLALHLARTAGKPGFCQACWLLPRGKADDGALSRGGRGCGASQEHGKNDS